ncbi:MAG TPA: hypothetical protein VI454_19320 [Verrucomicrobiae bacterium]|jgi:hypothetical protein
MTRQSVSAQAPKPHSHPRISGHSTRQKTGQDWEKLDEELFLLSYVIGAPIVVWLSYWLPGSEFILRWVTTLGAALWLVVAVTRVLCARLKSGCLKSGRENGHEVARGLDELGASGYRVAHHVVAGHYSVEHVLVGPAGVFVIDGRGVGSISDQHARRNARFIGQIAASVTGKPVDVLSIELSTTALAEATTQPGDELVLNLATLPTALRERPVVLTADEIERLCDCFEQLAVGQPVAATRPTESFETDSVKVYPFRAAMTH